MNIVVCIKQVPATTEVKMNKDTNTIIREGVESIINPFDMYAIEEALRIRDRLGGKVTVMSMGIMTVSDQLREAIALGADDTILVNGREFAGSDTLATAYALSMAIKKIGAVDLVICGKQATDGDTAQVGPSLAEKLGVPHTTYVRKIEDIHDGYIRCQRMTEDGYEVIEMPLPAIITVVKEINEPRLPSIKGMMRSKKAIIAIWNAENIGADKCRCGLKGSPTQVIKTFTPVHDIKSESIEGSVDEQAFRVIEILSAPPAAK